MKQWRRWIALALAGVLCCTLLAGCGEEGEEGAALSVCVGDDPVTLDPIYAQETADQTILVHLYENLMRVSMDASGKTTVTTGMAKSVDQETNYDGTVTYTFRLRSAKWSDGRAVQADDFVYAWRRLADPASQSPYAELLSVVAGYDEARAAGDMTLLQVSAKNDTTLVVVLSGNYDWFLTEVCTSPATLPLRESAVQKLKEAADAANLQAVEAGEEGDARWWSDPTALVTNGAYQVGDYEEGQALTLRRSERYYGSQSGPGTLYFRFAGSPEEAWALYEAQEVDAVWAVPEAQLEELAADESWTGIPELNTYAVLFNCQRIQDPLIRQAFSLAIDRSALAEAAGTAVLPAEGLVPPGVPGDGENDFRSGDEPLLNNDPADYADNCQAARELMEQAGYDSGASWGELEYLYVEEENNAAVAEALCTMWQSALGVRIVSRGVTEQELWAALRSGDYSVAGADLDAAGNDAECFLMQWTTASPDNVLGYANSAYDTLMSIIAGASDELARLGCLHDAEELLLRDYALAPLYTRQIDWQLREDLTGACRDARGWFVFSGVVERTV